MQKITTTQFLCHLRSWPITVEINQKKSRSGTIMFGINVSDLEQAKIAKLLQKAGYLDVKEVFFGKKKNLQYSINDVGRAASRGDEQTLSLEAAREMHDSDLSAKWGDHPIAKQVLHGRGQAAQQLRLVLARVYGKDGMCTHSHWSIIPCLTDTGTIGILNIANGTAWSTDIIAVDGVHDLGLVGEVYAAANGIAGDCYIDNKLVQRDGTAVEDGKTVVPSMPAGWRQIGLPTWRGYDPSIERYNNVPEELFRPEHWIKPTLVATSLMTCYNRPGNNDGAWFGECYGWEGSYPWGVPPWINGQSVTMLDTMADIVGGYVLERTRAPRGTDDEELQFLEVMYDLMLKEFAPRFASAAAGITQKQLKYHSVTEVRCGLKQIALAFETGTLPPKEADNALTALGNETNWSATSGMPQVYVLRSAHEALTKRLPHAAAVYLAQAGISL